MPLSPLKLLGSLVWLFKACIEMNRQAAKNTKK